MPHEPVMPRGTSVLIERMRAVAKGLNPKRPADATAFGEIEKLAGDMQDILDRAQSDLDALARRGDEILTRLMERIETKGEA